MLGPLTLAKKRNKRSAFSSSSLPDFVNLFSTRKNKATLGLCLQGKEYSLGAMTLCALCVFSSGAGAKPALDFPFHSLWRLQTAELFLTLP